MTDYQKIIDVMCWEVFDGETPEQTFVRESRNNTPLEKGSDILDLVLINALAV